MWNNEIIVLDENTIHPIVIGSEEEQKDQREHHVSKRKHVEQKYCNIDMICPNFIKGQCKQINCQYYHNLADYPCKFLAFTDNCTSKKCPFSHNIDLTIDQLKSYVNQNKQFILQLKEQGIEIKVDEKLINEALSQNILETIESKYGHKYKEFEVEITKKLDGLIATLPNKLEIIKQLKDSIQNNDISNLSTIKWMPANKMKDFLNLIKEFQNIMANFIKPT